MLSLERGEGRTASLMLAHAFCMGLSTVFFETAASALFLTRFPASAIPIVYIVAAIVSVVTGIAYSRLEKRVPFWPLMIGTLIFLFTTVLLFRIAVSITGAAIVVFALFVWYRLLSILTDVEYWAVASRLYDIRQAKRLFGFIGSGEVTARMLGAFAIPLLVKTIGTKNLIELSALGLFGSLVLLIPVSKREEPIKREPEARGPRPEARSVWRDGYVRTIIAVAAFGILGKHFVDFAFLQQMQSRYADVNRLASFFGIFSGVTQALNLVIRVTLSGRYLQRFGIAAGLQTLPAVHLICTLGLVIVAMINPGAAAVFWLVIANQGIYKTLKHPIDNPSVKVLYQPLRRETRLAVQVANEVIATPIAIGIAGAIMLFFTRFARFDIRVFGVVMLVTFALWIVSSRVAWRRYVGALRAALQRKRPVDLDAATLAAIREQASIEHPHETIPVEQALAQLDDRHARSSAAAALVRAGETSLDAIEHELLTRDSIASVQRLLRICGRIGGPRAAAIVTRSLASSDERVREQALTALVNMRARSDAPHEIETMIRSDAEEALAELSLREQLPQRFTLVRSALAIEADRGRNRVILALSLIGDVNAIERARRQLQSSSRERRAYATELLDASIPAAIRRFVLPLLANVPASAAAGDPDVILQRIIDGATFTPWTKAVARHALDEKGSPAMQSTIEKMLVLKSVDLFTQTPDDVLAQVAAEVEEVEMPRGALIINKGEIGDSLYVIDSGEVRVHDGDQTIATLGEREIFGELAVLDPEPRSASVTAQTDVRLFRLDREDLFELLPDHSEIVQGIFHVLCRRLRKH